MIKYVPVNEPLLNGNEKKYLIECIETGWISSEGPFVKAFEEKFAERIGRKHAIAVCNGSVAIDAAIEALGIGAGDEVIMPTFTIISCIAQIVRNGGKPVLVDCDPITWNMDVTQVEEKITNKTKAIMLVHIYGLPVNVEPILQIAERFGLSVLEDAAEAHGQTYNGRPCGSFGDISTFSFYPNKHVTTGEGGMILTDDDEVAERCRSLRNLYFQEKKRFVHDGLGWNLRMTNMQAALGVAQLERLDEFVLIKKKMGALYTEQLNSLNMIQLPLQKTEYAENIYWVYGIVLSDELGIDAETAMQKLAELGVGTRPFFYPMHKQPVLKKLGYFADEAYPVSEKIAKNGFYIPSGLALTVDQIEFVTSAVKEIINTEKS